MGATPALLGAFFALLVLDRLLPASTHFQYFQYPSAPRDPSEHFISFKPIQEHNSFIQRPSNRTPSMHRSYPSNFENQDTRNTWVHSSEPRVLKWRPTVRPARNFNPQDDAHRLRNALKSFADDDVIIGILTKRSSNQRQEIIQYYGDLKKDLQRKLSFDFRDLMEVLVTPPQSYIALHLKEALKFSLSVDIKLLVELLGTLSNSQLRIVKDEYRKLYGHSLQNDLTGFSVDKFTKFFSSYIEGNRDQRPWVDHELATKDAEALKKSGKLNIDNGGRFRYLLTYRSFNQLNQTFAEYQRIKREAIENSIKKDFSGKVRDGLLEIVKSITNRGNYFAEILHGGISSLGRAATLVRIIVLRSEIDMGDIKDCYGRLYRNSLNSAISSKTSGDFKKALLSLISG